MNIFHRILGILLLNMEYLTFLLTLLLVSLSFYFLFFKIKSPASTLPPGNTGWPVIGETLNFLSTGWKGQPEKFIFDRIAKYSSHVFRTHLLGESTIVFCGSNGNKFLFSNENKLVQAWWPSSMYKIFPFSFQNVQLRNFLYDSMKPEALQRYVAIMDHIAERHFADKWENKQEILTFKLAKNYTLLVACRVFFSIENPDHINKLAKYINDIALGILSIPIDLPGMQFSKAIKASKNIREQIDSTIKQRKIDLAEGKASPTQDILSYLILTSDENGNFTPDSDIANVILSFLIAGHDTTSSTCTFVVYYLAESPEIYERVYNEQMEITKSKKPGEQLNWDDLQKMKYSWNVACEVLRLASPAQGTFREAIVDFTYDGFSIPRGWKLYWSVNSTHKSPECFPDPKRFDPTRFEGHGPAPYTFVPFGGGPRMCPGKEFARIEILVFMHNLVKRFKFEKIISDEKIVASPFSVPSKGLPIRLYPRKGINSTNNTKQKRTAAFERHAEA